MQPDELARSVVLMVRASLAPLFERVAAFEARLATLDGVRDRVVAIETKQAMPAPPPVVDPAIAEVRGLVSRFADHSADPAVLVGLTTRLKALEDRPSPEPFDPRVHDMNTRLTEVEVACKSIETAVTVALSKELGGVRERLASLETRAPVPGPPGPAGVNGLDGKAGRDGVDGKDGKDAASADFAKDIETLRDRVQVVEVRGVVPGPVGPAGKDGASGRDGRDGHDGIALDDLSVAVEHERTFIFRARVGGQIKDIGALTVPVDIYRGVWVEGKTYERGDGVTWAGSEWHCNDTTTVKPGDGSRDWTLKVKRGRDGKDGKDAEQPLPVVKR